MYDFGLSARVNRSVQILSNNLNSGIAHMYKKSKSLFFADDLAAYQQEVPARDQPVKRLATSLA